MGSSLYPVAAIIPSLNPDEKLINTVHGLLKVGFTDVIVVDDGSGEIDECQCCNMQSIKEKVAH